MTLLSGTRLGPYVIERPLGAGGMGEVYRAKDSRLDRTVAIKVLSAPLAADPQFRERFDREARAISQLDHPHICALYDVGEERLRPARGAGGERGEGAPPSASERGWGPASTEEEIVRFLVMQYLEGETLESRLEKGALAVDEALKIAIQIADALTTAHRAAIVHRDLKPGNIFLVRSRGGSSDPPDAKLLDFGLAKASAPAVAAAALSMLPTTLTAQGTILGTFQYMAPEQLEGKDADTRSDIFAFGAVVYEMVTGKKAFEGKTQASLIHAIMGIDPPPISKVQPLVPAVLDRVVKKCLAKEADARWQSARDLHDELQWVAEFASHPAVSTPVVAQRGSRERLAWIVATASLVVAVATSLYFRPTVPEPVVTRLDVITPSTSDAFLFALSPDGRQLAFVADGEKGSLLSVRSLDQVTAQPLAGTEGASSPFWAPDGRAIGFFADSKLKRIDLSGGAPQVLADAPQGRGGTWNRDGIIVFAPLGTVGLMRVMATGGTPVPVTHLVAGQGSHRWPQFLPDGRRFLFLMSLGQAQTHGVYVASLDGGEPTRVLATETSAAYAPPGYLLHVSQGVLVAQSFDERRTTVAGEPIPVAQAVGADDGTARNSFILHRTID